MGDFFTGMTYGDQLEMGTDESSHRSSCHLVYRSLRF